MVNIVLLYPSGHSFDMDYYLSKHMKLIDEIWMPVGLKNWEVLQFPEGSPYQIQCTLRWESESAYNAAAADPSGKTIIADVPNYTTARPIRLQSTQKFTSSAA